MSSVVLAVRLWEVPGVLNKSMLTYEILMNETGSLELYVMGVGNLASHGAKWNEYNK